MKTVALLLMLSAVCASLGAEPSAARLAVTAPSAPLPQRLSETGLYVSDSLRVRADNIAFASFVFCAAVLDGWWESTAPFCDAGQEDDVLAGEFTQGGEFLEGGWIALEDVLECAHCEDAVARLDCAC